MDSKEMYGRLLGLKAPWTVERVEMDVAHQEMLVFVGHAPGTRFACPCCQRELALFDHLAERRWRHLDTCQFMTFLTARPPRIDCPEHGKLQVDLPCSEAGSRFANMFEALAIDVLLAANVKRAARLLHITWDEAWGVMQRAVMRGRAAKRHTALAHIGVDEKAIAQGHRYMTLVSDAAGGTVEYIGEGREEASLAPYFEAFTTEQLTGIEAISMDMWQPYINAATRAVPGADDKIVFDRFHIMQHVLDGVDRVRRA